MEAACEATGGFRTARAPAPETDCTAGFDPDRGPDFVARPDAGLKTADAVLAAVEPRPRFPFPALPRAVAPFAGPDRTVADEPALRPALDVDGFFREAARDAEDLAGLRRALLGMKVYRFDGRERWCRE